jgi:biopolymer transport protein ExbB
MKKTLKQTWILGMLALLIPTLALAWWSNDWGSRKTLTLDAGATGADIQATLSDVPVLVRLHTGNFGYFTELAENGKDLRFALDDKTPLKHAIEKVDALSEIGLVWIKVPTVRGAVSTDALSMYYGNQNAVEASDAKGINRWFFILMKVKPFLKMRPRMVIMQRHQKRSLRLRDGLARLQIFKMAVLASMPIRH